MAKIFKSILSLIRCSLSESTALSIFQHSYVKLYLIKIVTNIQTLGCNLLKKHVSVFCSFYWFPLLLRVSENPNQYNILPYKSYMIGVFCMILTIACIILYFKAIILAKVETLCLHALRHKKLVNFICYYCYFIIRLRGIFEFQPPYLIVFFSAPNLYYMTITSFQETYQCSDILHQTAIWTSFWFSLGILLISFDQLGAKIVSFCNRNPSHSFCVTLTNFLIQRNKVNIDGEKSVILLAGWIPTFGKMTAAGQAALFTGSAALLGTVFVASINVWHNERRDLRQAAKEDADRNAQTTRETADREATFKTQQAQYANEDAKRSHEKHMNKPWWWR